MSSMNLFTIFFTLDIAQNFITTLFLGFCPFFGVTKNFKDAVSMGGALSFVMIGSAAGRATTAPPFYRLFGSAATASSAPPDRPPIQETVSGARRDDPAARIAALLNPALTRLVP